MTICTILLIYTDNFLEIGHAASPPQEFHASSVPDMLHGHNGLTQCLHNWQNGNYYNRFLYFLLTDFIFKRSKDGVKKFYTIL
jgi:hypothetical protein